MGLVQSLKAKLSNLVRKTLAKAVIYTPIIKHAIYIVFPVAAVASVFLADTHSLLSKIFMKKQNVNTDVEMTTYTKNSVLRSMLNASSPKIKQTNTQSPASIAVKSTKIVSTSPSAVIINTEYGVRSFSRR